MVSHSISAMLVNGYTGYKTKLQHDIGEQFSVRTAHEGIFFFRTIPLALAVRAASYYSRPQMRNSVLQIRETAGEYFVQRHK